ncbi:MAG: 1-acyl-sn-glycerol-3-phosphate acyltransferase [Anaerolineales bacterium]|nr:1-acyl-sn-glycerol-3-phosphate acyltransferase [Anaerolineales bacterium]
MKSTYIVPLKIKFQRLILKTIFKIIMTIGCRVKVKGKENIPVKGPYLIVINHISYFDAPLLIAYWPFMPEVFGAADLKTRKGINFLVKFYGYIPVDRYSGYDRKVLEKVQSVLSSGYTMMLAPEGTRAHDLVFKRGNPGVAYIADKARVPIVPVAISGAHGDLLKQMIRFKFPRVTLEVGETMYLPELQGNGQTLREGRQYHTDYILYSLSKMLPENYRGFYAGFSDQDFESLIEYQKSILIQ